MKKRKIVLVLLIIILMILGGLTSYVFTIIPYNNLTAALVSNLPSTPNFIQSNALKNSEKQREYPDLPEVMTFTDGTDVKTVEEFSKRRTEMIEILQQEVYGAVPETDYDVTYEVVESFENALDGTAIRKQIKMTITTDKGSNEAMILMYTPKNVKNVPVFVALNVDGNVSVATDEAILKSRTQSSLSQAEINELRGTKSERWPVKEIIAAENAFVTIHCDDIAPNDNETYRTGVIDILAREDEEFKTISAWSFGLQRVMDYLVEETETIDATKMMTIGHSRFGKTSLWTAAQDERVAVAFANASGTVGSAMSRENSGETVAIINKMFPSWFVDNFDKYSDNEKEMDFDQHFLLAAIAPRKIYLSNGNTDYWADPHGEFNALKQASIAYQLYGYQAEEIQYGVKSVANNYFGYHLGTKNHDLTQEDWQYYLDYVDKYVK